MRCAISVVNLKIKCLCLGNTKAHFSFTKWWWGCAHNKLQDVMTAEKLQLLIRKAWSRTTWNNVFVLRKFFSAAKLHIKPGRKQEGCWMMDNLKAKTSASCFVYYQASSLALRCSASLFSGAKRDLIWSRGWRCHKSYPALSSETGP